MENDHVHVYKGGGQTQNMVKRNRCREDRALGLRLRTEGERKANIPFQRSKIYKLFSHLFSFPERDLFRFLKSGALLKEVEEAFFIIPPVPPFIKKGGRGSILLHLGLATEKCKRLNLNDLQEGYTKIFETPGERCLLNECNFLDFPQEEMADIAGFYRAFGFNFEQRPDHLGAELEFLHLLTVKEAKALLSGEKEKVEACIGGEKKFLSTHPGRWVEVLTKMMIEGKRVPYDSFASALLDWLRAEARYLGITLKGVEVSRMRKIFEDGFAPCQS